MLFSIADSALPYREGAFLFTDDTLKLSSGIVSRSLILREGTYMCIANQSEFHNHYLLGGSVIACAPIVVSESVETFQYPELDVRIRQSSPYENSTLEQSLAFKSESTYTILSAAWMTSGLCPLTGEVYNPLGVTPSENAVYRYSY